MATLKELKGRNEATTLNAITTSIFGKEIDLSLVEAISKPTCSFLYGYSNKNAVVVYFWYEASEYTGAMMLTLTTEGQVLDLMPVNETRIIETKANTGDKDFNVVNI